jgi:hypothetical protein
MSGGYSFLAGNRAKQRTPIVFPHSVIHDPLFKVSS